MAQFLRPDSDVAAGGWLGDPSNSLWDKLDEASADDGDFIQSSNNPSLEVCEVSLSDATDPESDSGHVVRYRYQKTASGGRTIELRVRLMENGTERASWTHANIPNGWTDQAQTLSAAQADSITDYANLRLEFRGDTSGAGGARRAQVSWAEMEVPDAPEPSFGWFVQPTDILIGAVPLVAEGISVFGAVPIIPSFSWFQQQADVIRRPPTVTPGIVVYQGEPIAPALEAFDWLVPLADVVRRALVPIMMAEAQTPPPPVIEIGWLQEQQVVHRLPVVVALIPSFFSPVVQPAAPAPTPVAPVETVTASTHVVRLPDRTVGY